MAVVVIVVVVVVVVVVDVRFEVLLGSVVAGTSAAGESLSYACERADDFITSVPSASVAQTLLDVS